MWFNSKHSTEWQLPALARFSVWNYLIVPNIPSSSHTGEMKIQFKGNWFVPLKGQRAAWHCLGIHCCTCPLCSPSSSIPQQPDLGLSLPWGLSLAPSRPGKGPQLCTSTERYPWLINLSTQIPEGLSILGRQTVSYKVNRDQAGFVSCT